MIYQTHILDIFTLFKGPPILQLGNKSKFANKLIHNLKVYWPLFKIAHFKATEVSKGPNWILKMHYHMDTQDECIDHQSEGL